MKIIFLLVSLMVCCCLSRANYIRNISGKVINENSVGIAGASVYLLNTNYASVTDGNGVYNLWNVPDGEFTLYTSALGYAGLTQTIRINKSLNRIPDIRLTVESTRLDEIVVTAQKKEELLQRVPVSVTSLNAKNISDYRLNTAGELTAIVPGLFADNPGDGRNVISIRGITSTSYDPSVTTYIDGVSQFSLDTYIPQLFDVERIEILRGPQGTLYGRNAMGGVINIITKKPGERTDGFAEIGLGNHGSYRFNGALHLPLVKNRLWFGAALLTEGLKGYYTNKYNNANFDDRHSLGGNYFLKYTNGSKWQLTLNVKHLLQRNYGPFPLAGSRVYAFANPFKVNQDATTKMIDNTWIGSLSANYSYNKTNLSSQTAFQSNYRYYVQPIDADFSPLDGITIINNYGNQWNHVKVITQEFKCSAEISSSGLKFTTGAFMFYQDAPNKLATHFGKDARMFGSPNINYKVINTTKAANLGASLYAQASYPVNRKMDLSFGLRYDYQYSKETVVGEYQPDASPVPVLKTQRDTTGHTSYGAFSPRVCFAVHPSENTNLYVSYSRGYRTGGLTQLSTNPSEPPLYAFGPEYSDNMEIGTKHILFHDHLRFNLALFYTLVSNAQVPTLILPDAITVTKNTGKLNSKGIETELSATFLNGLELNYNFGVIDSRYKTFDLSQYGSVIDLSGKHQVFTPQLTSMLALQFTVMLNKIHQVKLMPHAEWRWLGTTYFDLKNKIIQNPCHLFNAGIKLTTRHFELIGWGKNLSDRQYIAYAYDFGAVHLGNPLTYGISFKTVFH